MSVSRSTAKHILRIAHEPVYRRECGQVVITGHHVVNEYTGPRISTVVTEAYLARKGHSGIKGSFHVADPILMQRVTKESAPEGILAVIPYPTNLTGQMSAAFDRTLMLFNIADPRNLGSLARTALALGWNQLVLFGNLSVDPFNVESIRCSKGAILKLPSIVKTGSVDDITCSLGKDVTVLLAEKSEKITSMPDSQTKCVLVLGSESHGLRDLPLAIRILGHPISIKTASSMPFLSVSAAGAILMDSLRA